MESAIVLYPSPGRGHLVSMVELGKLLLSQNPSFNINIVVSIPPFEAGSTGQYVAAVSAANPSITFLHLPTVSLARSYSFPEDFPVLSYDLAELNNSNLSHVLSSLSKSFIIKAFIIDFFNTASFQVSSCFNIPTYYFFTSNASGLAAFLFLPTIHKNTKKSLKDLDILVEVPGVPPIPAKDMPVAILDRTTKAYEYFMGTAIHMAKSAGLIVNSFELLEQRALKAILNGECVLGESVPPIYCIGPVIETSNGSEASEDEHECLSWLNSQPSRSVLFLCFGSLGVFSAKQLQQMAIGLEKSGVRFLWVVRNPPPDQETLNVLTAAEPNLETLLPEGFLQRTKDKGLVVKLWAPQVKVLSHDSVGGFVTHCGWNSVLEALRAGVPMLAWPLYAEQKMNRLFLVEEMKVALWVSESEDGLVSAAELENRVNELMDSKKGKVVRERVMAMRDEAAAAREDGGSSRVALVKLINSLKRGWTC
ncbi:UDPGT domain-containing protein [Cephalotus follicularis]|uniref:Glycosyltransferase n=1 Tax=Cephalotus follicularis TaxID=3775 RepID=A0A1Q3BXT7_CEPFO|nr:UDPGT domain-containing protein [Cephalotus follicularis]